MFGRMSSKRSRPWDRNSPGRNERSRRRELDSPPRPRRSRWDSPPRSWRSDRDSPSRLRRKDLDAPSRFRRNDLDDGLRPADGQGSRSDRDVHGYSHRQIDRRADGKGPAGLVFMCSALSKRDCFRYNVFGLPLAQRDIVERIVPGTKLFLLDFDLKELYGIFEAVSFGGLNLVPEAFQDLEGSCPAQVRFGIYRECLPLTEDSFRDVIRENFYQRKNFDFELTADQVFKLTQLFHPVEHRSQNDAPRMGPLQSDERLGLIQENRLPAQLLDVQAIQGSSGFSSANAVAFSQNGGRFSTVAHEKNDAYLFPNHSESQFQVDKGDSSYMVGTGHLDGNVLYNAVGLLGQGQIEEVDQLALKYLQNDSGSLINRLGPVDSSLLSSSRYLSDYPHPSIHGLSDPQMDHIQRGRDQSSYPLSDVRLGTIFTGVNLQQEYGLQHPRETHFSAGFTTVLEGEPRIWNPLNQESNMLPPRFRIQGVMGSIDNRDTGLPPLSTLAAPNTRMVNTVSQSDAKAHPASSVTDFASFPHSMGPKTTSLPPLAAFNASRMDNVLSRNAAAEYPMPAASGGAMAVKSSGSFLPGARPSDRAAGILPLPGTTRGILPPPSTAPSLPPISAAVTTAPVMGPVLNGPNGMHLTSNVAVSSKAPIATPPVTVSSMSAAGSCPPLSAESSLPTVANGTNLPSDVSEPLKAASSTAAPAIIPPPVPAASNQPPAAKRPKRIRTRSKKKRHPLAPSGPQQAAGTHPSMGPVPRNPNGNPLPHAAMKPLQGNPYQNLNVPNATGLQELPTSFL